jgi:hypothetical protein
VEIKNYTITELEEWIEGDQYLRSDVMPISPVRVYSQKKNPHLHADDVVLTVARDENNAIAGYIGALPFTLNGEKCAWNSCWWVRKGAPAGVSMKLLFTFIQNWDRKVLFSEMTPHTVEIIEKLRLCNHKTTIGFRGYSRFVLSEVLPRKKKYLQHIKLLFKAIDFTANVFVQLLNAFKSDEDLRGYTFNTVDKLDKTDAGFIKLFNDKWTAPRTVEDFNWIAANQWVIPVKEAHPEIMKRYYFSYAVERFEQKWIRVFNKKKQVGIFNASIRDNHLKIQYVYASDEAIGSIGNWVANLLRQDKTLCCVTTFHEALSAYLSKKNQFIFSTDLPKYSAISNELASDSDVSVLAFQMGDGDVIFT